MTSGSGFTVRTSAKLNLTLEVLGTRDDGYHEIATVLQTVSLWDTLSFRPAAGLDFTCSDPGLASSENLVVRAARLLQRQAGTGLGAAIHLEKAIPAAAGLGGGSSDAAATLWALDRLWDLRLPAEDLHGLATTLGSDVPFFLEGGTAMATGRGDRVEPLPPPRKRWFLVLHPPLKSPTQKTRALYALVHGRHHTPGRVTEAFCAALRQSGLVREACLYNAFDAVAFTAFPDLHDWRRLLLEVAPSRPHLAGSGPSLFIPVGSQAQGQAIVAAVEAQDTGPIAPSLFLVHTVPFARELVEEA